MDSTPGGSGSQRPSTQTAATATAPPLQPPSSSWDHERDCDQDLKRPVSQSQLLPPLELLSSSPGLPNGASTRRMSRPGSTSKGPSATINNLSSAKDKSNAYLQYPTPIPTSSTGILSSSPPRVLNGNHVPADTTNPDIAAVVARPPLQRAASTVSVSTERAPLSAVPTIELNENGDTLLMGRSSNSSHYQLSANRLISRVHVRARYIAATVPLQPNRIEVECNGWNGLKLHCQGRSYDMLKGDALTFETEGAEIMLDVQDARVFLHWPKRDGRDALADMGWEDSPRSVRHGGGSPGGSPRVVHGSGGLGMLQSSPLRRTARISSPVSPTPAHVHMHANEAPSNSQHSSILSDLPSVSDRERSVEIYEDEDADLPFASSDGRRQSTADQSFITDVNKSFSSDLSDVHSDDEQGDENNSNEENDPIIHSFGPFGENLNSRLGLASLGTASPKRRRLDSGNYATASPSPRVTSASRALSAAANHDGSPSASTSRQGDGPSPVVDGFSVSVKPDLTGVDVPTVANHVVNQLAFSRLSSNPLSTLLANLPAEDREGLSRDQLRYIVETTTCIGTIPRQGKDADGKPLESQYYYMPERDDDENRRAAVVDGLRKPTLRNCRKHHVVSFFSLSLHIVLGSCLCVLSFIGRTVWGRHHLAITRRVNTD